MTKQTEEAKERTQETSNAHTHTPTHRNPIKEQNWKHDIYAKTCKVEQKPRQNLMRKRTYEDAIESVLAWPSTAEREAYLQGWFVPPN